MTRQLVEPLTDIWVAAPRRSKLESNDSDPAYAVAFVGDEVWVQRGHTLWRFHPDDASAAKQALDLTGVRLFRALGPWLDFRVDSSYLSGAIVAPSTSGDAHHLRGVWLFDTRHLQWHEGSWPSGINLCVNHDTGPEPEDSWLYAPFEGVMFDAAFHDRTWLPVAAPGGRWATIAGTLVDLRRGECPRHMGLLEVPLDARELQELGVPVDELSGDNPGIRRLPCIGDDAAKPEHYCEAVAVDGEGRLWTVANFWVSGPNRLADFLAVEDTPLAVVRPLWRAAAFDREVRRVALVDSDQLIVMELAALDDDPLFRFAFPELVRPDDSESTVLGVPEAPIVECDEADIPF